ncbi:MAG: hypothetical protein IJ481_03955 [Alphaproteobacteria bacterium]|nr:hypothetical protein [Alphaproteobacteria bacterium]
MKIQKHYVKFLSVTIKGDLSNLTVFDEIGKITLISKPKARELNLRNVLFYHGGDPFYNIDNNVVINDILFADRMDY